MPKKKTDSKTTVDYETRKGPEIDWSPYFCNVSDGIKRSVPYSRLLPGTYDVRRVIWKKDTSYRKCLYLVEWDKYDLADATWEPNCHLDKKCYDYPQVSDDARRIISRRFEDAIQKVLRKKVKSSYFYMAFPLDIFRCMFLYQGTVARGLEGFYNFCMSAHWYYYIDDSGRCTELDFPIRIEPKLSYRNVRVKTADGVITKRQPVERIKVYYSLKETDYKD